MILYDFGCANGHEFEWLLAKADDKNPDCMYCGQATRRQISALNLVGRTDAGPSRDEMPQSWNATGQGDPELIEKWRQAAIRREKLEEQYPLLAGDHRPVLAHEGIFEGRPLKLGDDIASAVAAALAAAKDETPTA